MPETGEAYRGHIHAVIHVAKGQVQGLEGQCHAPGGAAQPLSPALCDGPMLHTLQRTVRKEIAVLQLRTCSLQALQNQTTDPHYACAIVAALRQHRTEAFAPSIGWSTVRWS